MDWQKNSTINFKLTFLDTIEREKSIGNKLKKSNLYREIFYTDLTAFNCYSESMKYDTIFYNIIHEKDIKNIISKIKYILSYNGILIIGFIKNSLTTTLYFNNFMERFEFSENYLLNHINRCLSYLFSKEVEFTNGEIMKIMAFKNDKT